MSYEFYEAQLRRQYALLQHKGCYTQAFCWDTINKRIVSRELLNGEEALISWAKKHNGQGNCFIGRNPRDKDGNVVVCTSLSLDIDPIREKGSGANDYQHDQSISFANLLISRLKYGVVCSSGNGALAMFPLETPMVKEQAEQYGKALEEYCRKFLVEAEHNGRGSLNVQIDSTYDAARLVKAMGCISTKGDKILWRHARFVAGIKHINMSESFLQTINKSISQTKVQVFIPEVEKGDFDRSKRDYAIAVRLKEQGFGPDDTYQSLLAVGMRGREDDYRRIVDKLYFSRADISELAPRNPITLWTPSSGYTEYTNRVHTGNPELPTGFSKLDRSTFGLTRGHIFTVGARTNAGKTTLAINVSVHLGKAGKRILYISTESTFQEIWDRYIACATGVSAFAIQHGLLHEHDKEIVDAFVKEFRDKHQFNIYDGSRPNIGIVRQAVEQSNCDVMVFDYFQHIENRETRELEEFVMQIKELAKQKQIAVLMCAQLHDRYDFKTHKPAPPMLFDIKNCKAISDESRVVVLLDWDRDNAIGDGAAAVKAILAKNKGVKEDVILKLDRTIPRFTEES